LLERERKRNRHRRFQKAGGTRVVGDRKLLIVGIEYGIYMDVWSAREK